MGLPPNINQLAGALFSWRRPSEAERQTETLRAWTTLAALSLIDEADAAEGARCRRLLAAACDPAAPALERAQWITELQRKANEAVDRKFEAMAAPAGKASGRAAGAAQAFAWVSTSPVDNDPWLRAQHEGKRAMGFPLSEALGAIDVQRMLAAVEKGAVDLSATRESMEWILGQEGAGDEASAVARAHRLMEGCVPLLREAEGKRLSEAIMDEPQFGGWTLLSAMRALSSKSSRASEAAAAEAAAESIVGEAEVWDAPAQGPKKELPQPGRAASAAPKARKPGPLGF
jgi:hypothetical protein